MTKEKDELRENIARIITNGKLADATARQMTDTILALQELGGREERLIWQPIETAPKGYPALEHPSEWFIAWGRDARGPKGSRWAIIRRTFHNGFGPWQGTGDEQSSASVLVAG